MAEPSRKSRDEDKWVRRLYLPAYSVSEAAMLAQVDPRTVSRWFYGYLTSAGRRADRVLGDRKRRVPLSYLQLVEVAFVASMRQLGVALNRIRVAHEYLSTRFGVEYPFAQLRLKTDGVEVLKDLEDVEGRWVTRLLVASRCGQVVWAEPIADRIREFDYHDALKLAIRWFPRGRGTPIMVDPRVQFGAPVLADSGVPTWVIRERRRAGESLGEIEEGFGVDLVAIRHALEFEGLRAATTGA